VPTLLTLGPLPAPWRVAIMLARWRSPPRLRSDPAGPDGGPVAGEGPVGVLVGILLERGPSGGAVGDTALRAPSWEELVVWMGAGANLAMREGCIPGGGPLSGAGVECCEDGFWRSANGGASLRPGCSLGVLPGAGEFIAGSFRPLMADPGAVKLRPPLPAGPLDARGPDGVSGNGALVGPFSRP
jgi:hypothetical protein